MIDSPIKIVSAHNARYLILHFLKKKGKSLFEVRREGLVEEHHIRTRCKRVAQSPLKTMVLFAFRKINVVEVLLDPIVEFTVPDI